MISKANSRKNVDQINAIIERQYDPYIVRQLSDLMLMPRYMNCNSCKKVVDYLEKTADKLELVERKRRIYMNKMLPMIISPGVKASIRGVAFNEYIKRKLLKFSSNKILSIQFEPKGVAWVSEIPDWIIEFKGGKTVIGYNQLDLWMGGAQVNRASKYIMDEALHKRLNKKNIYIVCVVARRYKVGYMQSKVADIIITGVKKKRIVWPKGLNNYLENLH